MAEDGYFEFVENLTIKYGATHILIVDLKSQLYNAKDLFRKYAKEHGSLWRYSDVSLIFFAICDSTRNLLEAETKKMIGDFIRLTDVHQNDITDFFNSIVSYKIVETSAHHVGMKLKEFY